MTYRELLSKIVTHVTDLDSQVNLRLRHRDSKEDPVSHVQIIPIVFYSVREQIAVDMCDIREAKVQLNTGEV